MPTRRLGPPVSSALRACRNVEHFPPMHQVFGVGLYEHECPGCGRKTMFQIDAPVLQTIPGSET